MVKKNSTQKKKQFSTTEETLLKIKKKKYIRNTHKILVMKHEGKTNQTNKKYLNVKDIQNDEDNSEKIYGRGKLIKINNTELYVQNSNIKGKGNFRCRFCPRRFRTSKERNRHNKFCGLIPSEYKKNREHENEKIRKMNERKSVAAKKNENTNEIKKLYENNNIEDYGGYIYVDKKYKFYLPYIKNRNNLLYYGSYFNKYTILKIFKYDPKPEKKIYDEIKKMNYNEKDSLFPTVIFFQGNVLIETYEGPSLKNIFDFCEKIEKPRCDIITLCNIAIDVLSAYNNLISVGLFYFDIKPENLTWNFKKNKIILIDFDCVFNEKKSNHLFQGIIGKTPKLRSIESLIYFLMYAYKGLYWENSHTIEQICENKNINFKYKKYKDEFQDLPILCKIFEEICSSEEFDNSILNKLNNFFSNKLATYNNIEYRFIWENYLDLVYKKMDSGKIAKNYLQKIFNKPFRLKKYFSYLKRKKNDPKPNTKSNNNLIEINKLLKNINSIKIDENDDIFIKNCKNIIKTTKYLNGNEFLRKQLIKKCSICNKSGEDFIYCTECSDCFHKKCVNNYFDVCERCQNYEGPNYRKICKEYKIYFMIFNNINTSYNKFRGTLKVPKKFNKINISKPLKEKKLEFSDNLVYTPNSLEILNKYFLEDVQKLDGKNLQNYYQFKANSIKGIYCPLEITKSNIQNYIVKSTEPIDSNTIICEYAGDVLLFRDMLFREKNDSKMDLINGPNSDLSLVIYPYKHANLGRFLSGINNAIQNDCNVLSLKVRINDSIHILLIAKRNIKKGEILYYDYNNGVLNEYDTSNFVKE